jgi:hypothetical protein
MTWRSQSTRIFRYNSHYTFSCYFIKHMKNCWYFISTSRICNEMIIIIYQTNCRLGARTVVTRDWILDLLCSRILLFVVTILTLEKVVVNAETPVTSIAGSIVYVFHESGVMWKMSEFFPMKKHMYGQWNVMSYSAMYKIEVTGLLWRGNKSHGLLICFQTVELRIWTVFIVLSTS